MLLFSTVLEINDSLTPDEFIRLAIEWNQTSTYEINRIPEIQWNGERNIRFGDENRWLAVEEYQNENIIAIRYEKTDAEGAVWDTDYVINFNEMKMSVRLDRSYLESALTVGRAFSTPHFITILIEHGHLKPDGDLPVSNKPVLIDETNIDLLSGVINGERNYRLPVVYVSKTYYDEDPVDTGRMAGRLKGVAHILVQKERWSNSVIRRACEEKNEYHGAIGIYFPKEHKKFMYRAYDGIDELLMERVIRAVIHYSNTQMVDTLYTWTGVNNALLRDQYSSQKEGRLAAELEKAQALDEAEKLIESVDDDIRRLQDHVTKLIKQIETLTYENQGLRAKIDRAEDLPLLFFGEEEDFYQGEIRDIILSAIAEKLKNTQPGSRRQHILADILERNAYEGLADKRAEELKKLLTGYKTMSSTTRQALLDFGFTITEEGKHYRLTYYGDTRYKTTLAKTGSDVREGMNSAQQIIRGMF